MSNLEHFCPLFKLPKWVSFCPDGLSFCPEYHPQFLFFTQLSHTPFGDMYIHKIPPSPPQNTPFPGQNLKVDKMNYSLGNLNPNWAKCLKRGEQWLLQRPRILPPSNAESGDTVFGMAAAAAPSAPVAAGGQQLWPRPQ